MYVTSLQIPHPLTKTFKKILQKWLPRGSGVLSLGWSTFLIEAHPVAVAFDDGGVSPDE